MKRSNRKGCECLPSRRQMLGLLGAGTVLHDPIKALLAGIVDGLVSKAQAAENPSAPPPRNYLYVGLAGAPARWYFDLPFFPYNAATTGMVVNPNVNTSFNASGVPEYRRIAITRGGETIQMPFLWASTIPTPGGGETPMANLLDNMVMIRGLRSPVDGHTVNHYLGLQPIAGGPSLAGLVADASPKPIPAVGVQPEFWGAYKSPKGIGQVNLYGFPNFGTPALPAPTNPLAQLLTPFDRTADGLGAGYMSRRQAMDAALKQVMDTVGNYAKSNVPGASALHSLRSKAEGLIRDGIGNVATEYAQLYSKYRALILACAQGMTPGAGRLSPLASISDRAVPPPANVLASNFYNHASTFTASNPDLRTLIQDSSLPIGLADTMAIAEYLFKHGYSSSVSAGIQNFVTNINLLVAANQVQPTPDLARLSLDSHANGSYVDLLTACFTFRCVAACLYELITQLKAANLWKETVIHLSSEFGRKPRATPEGSDHGIEGGSVSILSGAIDKPYVIGDTQLVPPPEVTAIYPGSWGFGAQNDLGGGAKAYFSAGYAASTIAHLLRVKTPTPNNLTLLQEKSTGGIELTYVGKAKEV